SVGDIPWDRDRISLLREHAGAAVGSLTRSRPVKPSERINCSCHRIKREWKMIDTLALQQQVTALFAEKLNLDVASAETDLIEAGLLDSLALVELLAQLEESFDVSISTDDMELENFRSITSIAMFVMQRAAVGVEV